MRKACLSGTQVHHSTEDNRDISKVITGSHLYPYIFEDISLVGNMKILRKTFLHRFKDHVDKHVLGVVYPFETPETMIGKTSQQILEELKASDIPCYQIYVTTPSEFLDHTKGQIQAMEWIAEILTQLQRSGFFTAFDGVRFELYDGSPAFGRYLDSRKSNRQCLEAISLHAIGEREDRNTIACLRGALREHTVKNYARSYFLKQDEGAEEDELIEVFSAEQRLRARIFDLAQQVSPGAARYDYWRNMEREQKDDHDPVTLRRSCSLSDLKCCQQTFACCFPQPETCKHREALALSVFSVNFAGRRRARSTEGINLPYFRTSEQAKQCTDFEISSTAVSINPLTTQPFVNNRALLSGRTDKLFETALCRYQIPFMPNSYYSPNCQPWHSVVILLTGLDLIREKCFVLRFNNDASFEESTDAACMSYPGDMKFKLQETSMGSTETASEKPRPNLGAVLAYHLDVLGLGDFTTLSRNNQRCYAGLTLGSGSLKRQTTSRRDCPIQDLSVSHAAQKDMEYLLKRSDTNDKQSASKISEDNIIEDYQSEVVLSGLPRLMPNIDEDIDMVL